MRHLFPKWLRDRARTLDEAADRAERSFVQPDQLEPAKFMAGAYRDAAALLERRAAQLELHQATHDTGVFDIPPEDNDP